jgi:hypothetical protein
MVLANIKSFMVIKKAELFLHQEDLTLRFSARSSQTQYSPQDMRHSTIISLMNLKDRSTPRSLHGLALLALTVSSQISSSKIFDWRLVGVSNSH